MQASPTAPDGTRQQTPPVGHPILVAVDFSSGSRAALQFAANFIRCVSAPLLVLHVIHEPGSEPGFYRKNGTPGALRPVEDIARDMLKDFVDDVCGSCRDAIGPLTPRLLLVSGLPATRIQEIAVREQAGLIVMGTHARTGLARMAMGSVSIEVMQHCHVPVTIVKAQPGHGGGNEALATMPAWSPRPEAERDAGQHSLT